MRRNPRLNGPAALPLVCLAPHGVFPASRIAPRAVSSYLAFSTLPAGIAADWRYIFCDTFRQRPLTRMLPACSTRHVAVWCSDFPPASLAAHQRSSAIARKVTRRDDLSNRAATREPRSGARRGCALAWATRPPSGFGGIARSAAPNSCYAQHRQMRRSRVTARASRLR